MAQSLVARLLIRALETTTVRLLSRTEHCQGYLPCSGPGVLLVVLTGGSTNLAE